jgi:hypothetical protein
VLVSATELLAAARVGRLRASDAACLALVARTLAESAEHVRRSEHALAELHALLDRTDGCLRQTQEALDATGR